MKKYAIGIDVGGSHISCKYYDLLTNQLIEDSLKHLPLNNLGSKEEVFSTFVQLLKPCVDDLGDEQLAGIGLAFPGPIDYENGIGLFNGDNSKYLSLYKVNIRQELSDRLGIGSGKIRFINDATAFAIGEYKLGALKDAQRALAITLGTGFGAAFLEKGIPVIDDDRVPGGGCLWHLAFAQTIADDYFSTRGLIERFKSLSGINVQGVKEMAELYDSNETASSVFKDFGIQLAILLKPWLLSFEVDKLVIGGNISKAYKLFEEHLINTLSQDGIQLTVSPSHFLEDSAFIGAASLMDDSYYNTLLPQLKLM